jgi:hypothetical protein
VYRPWARGWEGLGLEDGRVLPRLGGESHWVRRVGRRRGDGGAAEECCLGRSGGEHGERSTARVAEIGHRGLCVFDPRDVAFICIFCIVTMTEVECRKMAVP